jgi:hypothetical protein
MDVNLQENLRMFLKLYLLSWFSNRYLKFLAVFPSDLFFSQRALQPSNKYLERWQQSSGSSFVILITRGIEFRHWIRSMAVVAMKWITFCKHGTCDEIQKLLQITKVT